MVLGDPSFEDAEGAPSDVEPLEVLGWDRNSDIALQNQYPSAVPYERAVLPKDADTHSRCNLSVAVRRLNG